MTVHLTKSWLLEYHVKDETGKSETKSIEVLPSWRQLRGMS